MAHYNAIRDIFALGSQPELDKGAAEKWVKVKEMFIKVLETFQTTE